MQIQFKPSNKQLSFKGFTVIVCNAGGLGLKRKTKLQISLSTSQSPQYNTAYVIIFQLQVHGRMSSLRIDLLIITGGVYCTNIIFYKYKYNNTNTITITFDQLEILG